MFCQNVQDKQSKMALLVTVYKENFM